MVLGVVVGTSWNWPLVDTQLTQPGLIPLLACADLVSAVAPL